MMGAIIIRIRSHLFRFSGSGCVHDGEGGGIEGAFESVRHSAIQWVHWVHGNQLIFHGAYWGWVCVGNIIKY